MDKSLKDSAKLYKKALKDGELQSAYMKIIKYIMKVKYQFDKNVDGYKTGGMSFGYLDYTYFPFYNAYLRENLLRFGIVLNHSEMQFELWLMGQNAKIQDEYWDKLKSTHWNKGKERPVYSVLECKLVGEDEFDDEEELINIIINRALNEAKIIEEYLKSI